MPASLADASNSIKKCVTLRCSLRLPPCLDVSKAKEIVKKVILDDKSDTYGAKVDIISFNVDNGFNTKELESEIKKAFFDANKVVFNGNEPIFIGCGGSIPFMEFFSVMYPKANFLLTGVGFPDSNAHAANENLDLDFCRKLTSTIALTLANL